MIYGTSGLKNWESDDEDGPPPKPLLPISIPVSWDLGNVVVNLQSEYSKFRVKYDTKLVKKCHKKEGYWLELNDTIVAWRSHIFFNTTGGASRSGR